MCFSLHFLQNHQTLQTPGLQTQSTDAQHRHLVFRHSVRYSRCNLLQWECFAVEFVSEPINKVNELKWLVRSLLYHPASVCVDAKRTSSLVPLLSHTPKTLFTHHLSSNCRPQAVTVLFICNSLLTEAVATTVTQIHPVNLFPFKFCYHCTNSRKILAVNKRNYSVDHDAVLSVNPQ